MQSSILDRTNIKKSVLYGASSVTFGIVCAQVLILLSSPVITRLYSPENFGVLAVYISLLAPLGMLANLRYELAIPLPAEDYIASRIVLLNILIVTVFTIILSLVIFFFKNPIAYSLNISLYADYLWLLSIGVILSGLYKTVNYWAIRTKLYPEIARTKISQAIAMIAIQILGSSFGPIALIFGRIAGQSAGLRILAMPLFRLRKHLFREIKWSQLSEQAVIYRNFPLFSTWGGLCNILSSQLPVLLFAAVISPAFAGFYALSQRVLSMPASVIGEGIGMVFHGNAAKANHNGELAKLFADLNYKLSLFAILPTIVLIVMAPEIFYYVFGSQWEIAGRVSQIMAPVIYFQMVVAPISTVFGITNNQRIGLVLQITLLTMRLSALGLGFFWNEPFIIVSCFSIASVIAYIIFLVSATKVSGNSWKITGASTLFAIFSGILWMSPLIILRFLDASFYVLLMGLMISSVFTMLGLTKLLKGK